MVVVLLFRYLYLHPVVLCIYVVEGFDACVAAFAYLVVEGDLLFLRLGGGKAEIEGDSIFDTEDFAAVLAG